MKKILVGLLLVLPLTTYAATGILSGTKITKLITSDERFGGCMAMVDKTISTAVSTCPDQWVTFACDGSFNNSISRAMMKWENAKLAYALGKSVFLRVDGNKTANGYCYADILRLEDQ